MRKEEWWGKRGSLEKPQGSCKEMQESRKVVERDGAFGAER